MVKLPLLSGKEIMKALRKAGFEYVKRRSSHVKLKRKTPQKNYIVIVPDYKEVDRYILNKIIKNSGLTRDEFMGLL